MATDLTHDVVDGRSGRDVCKSGVEILGAIRLPIDARVHSSDRRAPTASHRQCEQGAGPCGRRRRPVRTLPFDRRNFVIDSAIEYAVTDGSTYRIPAGDAASFAKGSEV
ncbi:hypothetical protein [Gordonia paraffinivorans]|uniref:hypothetical protein n=1 Tax=Gordonia paraffinivorans TaxID=175628 RepID=UPI001446C591|nr:hypothetical protein [Gordonia paraffinivorans]